MHDNIVSAICVCELSLGLSYKNAIPWTFAEDRKLFQHYTMHHPVIMGYITYKTLEAPLQMRQNYVLTSQKNLREGFIHLERLEDGLRSMKNPYIIGGAQLYNYALQQDYIDQFIICRLHHKHIADTCLQMPWHNFTEPQIIFYGDSYSIMRYRKKTLHD